jgi:hypothetical protein
MALTAIDTYTNNGLVPAYPNIPSPMLPVKLLPSLTLARGTWLEELPGGAAITGITATQAITASGVAQTVTVSATTNFLAGRTLIVNAGLVDEETVTILSFVAATSVTAVFLRTHATAATLTAPASAGTGVYQAFASGLARCILKYAVASDASGMITLGTASTGGPFGEKSLDTPAYFGGAFRSEETTGGTSTGLGATGLNGHLMHGTLVTGVFAF